MVVMNKTRTAVLFLLLYSTVEIFAFQPQPDLISYSWEYMSAVHRTLLVPPGYTEETQAYREGIVTYLRYPDSAYIVLQHGGMYDIPLFQGTEHSVDLTEERPGMRVRTGSSVATGLFWREDNYLPGIESASSLADFFPPNVAYSNVANNRVELFNRALDSFRETRGD